MTNHTPTAAKERGMDSDTIRLVEQAWAKHPDTKPPGLNHISAHDLGWCAGVVPTDIPTSGIEAIIGWNFVVWLIKQGRSFEPPRGADRDWVVTCGINAWFGDTFIEALAKAALSVEQTP